MIFYSMQNDNQAAENCVF